MIRRERDARRVAKSIRTHEKTMMGYNMASSMNLSNKNYTSTITRFDDAKNEMVSDKEVYPSVVNRAIPETVRISGSATSKVDRQRKKGLITQGEAASEKLEIAAKNRRIH
jgi:predicted NAD-dependent protein-ADP-ribosyltransferase YbiA (DUF1768 family)